MQRNVQPSFKSLQMQISHHRTRSERSDYARFSDGNERHRCIETFRLVSLARILVSDDRIFLVGTSTLSQQGRRFAADVKPPCKRARAIFSLSVLVEKSVSFDLSDSYIALITLAIESSKDGKMTLNGWSTLSMCFHSTHRCCCCRNLQIYSRTLSVLQWANGSSLAEFHSSQSLAERLLCEIAAKFGRRSVIEEQRKLLDVARKCEEYVRQRDEFSPSFDAF